MLNESRIVCFLATKNPEIAKEFYQDILGLKLIEDTPHALVFDANGTTLRIQKVREHTPAKHTSVGWEVNNIRANIEALLKKDVCFERYEGLQQDELGIWRTLDGAQIAWFKDPDGNILSLTQLP